VDRRLGRRRGVGAAHHDRLRLVDGAHLPLLRADRRPVQQAALAVSRNDTDNPPTFDATVEWRLTLD
jgi:hypothetical protein